MSLLSAPPLPAAAKPGRRYDIDALRVLAFGLLILYHCGMFYVADWGWHVKSAYQSESLQVIMRLVNQWRMPLLFMISGIAVHFLLGRLGPGAFAWARIKRLLLPLLFGMAVVVPPQAYYQALSNGVIEPGYADFLWRYFTFQPWPANAFDGSDPGITWNHLWYLPYLLFYTLALIPLALLLNGRGKFLVTVAQRVRGVWLVLLPVVPLLLYGSFIFPHFPFISHGLKGDWYAHAMYFTFFLYGYLLGQAPELWAEIGRLRKATLPLALVCFGLMLWFESIVPDNAGRLAQFPGMLALYLNRWLSLLAVLGWGYVLLNKPFRWLAYANEAVFSWYMLHQTITVTAGYQLARLALGPVVEPVLVVGITVAGCLLLHEFVIRRVAWLRPLFGLKAAAPVTSPRPVRTVEYEAG